MSKGVTLIRLAVLCLVVGYPFTTAESSPRMGGSIDCPAYAGSHSCKTKTMTPTDIDTWDAGVSSEMENPRISIGTIGWSWWTVRETCNGNFLLNQQYGGSVSYNTYVKSQTRSYFRHACSGTHQGWSMGNHDFYQSGYAHITPYWEYWGYLP